MKFAILTLTVCSLLLGICYRFSDLLGKFAPVLRATVSLAALAMLLFPCIRVLRTESMLPEFNTGQTNTDAVCAEAVVLNTAKKLLPQEIAVQLCARFSIAAEDLSVSLSYDDADIQAVDINAVYVGLHKKSDRILCNKISSYLSDLLACPCTCVYEAREAT